MIDEYIRGRIPVGGAVRFHAQLGQTGVKTDLVDQTARYRDCELRQLFDVDSSGILRRPKSESRFLGFFPLFASLRLVSHDDTMHMQPRWAICILNMSYPHLTVNSPFIALFDMFDKGRLYVGNGGVCS